MKIMGSCALQEKTLHYIDCKESHQKSGKNFKLCVKLGGLGSAKFGVNLKKRSFWGLIRVMFFGQLDFDAENNLKLV